MNKTIVKNESGDDSQETNSPIINADKKLIDNLKQQTGKEYRSTSECCG